METFLEDGIESCVSRNKERCEQARHLLYKMSGTLGRIEKGFPYAEAMRQDALALLDLIMGMAETAAFREAYELTQVKLLQTRNSA